MSRWGSLLLSALAVFSFSSPIRAADQASLLPGLGPALAPLSLFVRKLPVPQEPPPIFLRRTYGVDPSLPPSATEFGARFRLTEQSSAYMKVLKFRARKPEALRGVQASPHTMLERPRAKAFTAGIRFAF